MTVLDDPDGAEIALGAVVVADRGSLPFALLHGESLVAWAAWALGAAGASLVDATVPWSEVRDAGRAVVLHDALCPATPPSFIEQCVVETLAHDAATVGVRTVTDTVKRTGGENGDVLGVTVDRTRLVAVASPLVLPASVVRGLDAPPLATDFTTLVAALAARRTVRRLIAPAQGRRVLDEADLTLLAAATAPAV